MKHIKCFLYELISKVSVQISKLKFENKIKSIGKYLYGVPRNKPKISQYESLFLSKA